MTDLVEAMWLCESHIKEIETEIRYYDYQIGANIDSIRSGLRQNLNSWLTHKAEFEEHKRSQQGYCYAECLEDTGYDSPFQDYPCDFITTKAKRLLGRE